MKTNNRKGRYPVTERSTLASAPCFRKIDDDFTLEDIVQSQNDQGDVIEDLLGGGGVGGETPEKKAAREAVEAAAKTKLDTENATKVLGEMKTKYADVLNGVTDVAKIEEKDGVVNVYDSTGKLVKSMTSEPAAPVMVELDGVKYKLNDKGDALDENGVIVKTKAQLDEIEAASAEEPAINEIITLAGYHPKGEDGKPKVYEDTPAGVLAYTNDLAEYKAEQRQRDFYTAYPKAEKYARHLAAGGTDENFFNFVKDDYSKVVLDDKNTDQQKQVIKALLIRKGFTPEKADKQIKYHEQANELPAEAKDALTELQGMQSKSEADKKASDDAAIAAETKRIESHWTAVDQVVKQGKAKDVIIPEAVREKFFQYMSAAVDANGNSQAMLDASKEDIETRVMIDLMRFLKYDVSSLVKAAVSTAKVRSLRTRLSKATSSSGSSGGEGAGGKLTPEDIDLNNLLT